MSQAVPELPDLARLNRFLKVVEAGSLTRAAAALDSTQSALSLQIAALEREFGGRLFHRTGRGVALTELGTRILPRVRALLLDAGQLAADIRSGSGVIVGEVVLGVLPSAAYPLVGMLLRHLREHCPGVQLRVLEGSNGQIAEWLGQGRLDIAIMFRYSGRGFRDAQSLATVGSYLIGAPGDEVTRAATVKFARLHRLPLVLAGAPNGLRISLDQLAKRKRIELNVVLEADSIPIQKDIVADGQAYTILAWRAVAREVEAGVLQAARIVAPAIDRTLVLATTQRRPLTLAAREVASRLRRIAQELVGAGAWRQPAP